MKKILTPLLAGIGGVLILAAAALIAATQVSILNHSEKNAATLQKMLSLMPEVQDASPNDRINTDPPLLEIDGVDYFGIVEVPGYGKALPVGGSWSKKALAHHPQRFDGSIYDGSLILGGSGTKGQMDYLHKVSIGDTVTVTDVSGDRYSYTIKEIKKKRSASTEALTSEEADLILFARDRKALNYTLVFCDFQ